PLLARRCSRSSRRPRAVAGDGHGAPAGDRRRESCGRARELRNELADAVNYLLVSLFPVPGFPALGMSDSARLSYISHRPYMRAGREADELLTFVVNSLIHTDDNVGPGQARRRQLIPVTGFGKLPDAILRKKLKCFSVSHPVPCPVRCRRGPA